MSIMLGLEKMPYCCAAKSNKNDAGAISRAVECVTPMMLKFELEMVVMTQKQYRRKPQDWNAVSMGRML